MVKNRISRVIILGIFSLIGIIIFQVFWIYNTFSNSEKQFNQTVKIALFNVAKNMATIHKDQMPDTYPVNQISTNNFVVDINDEIDPNILERLLKKEFEARHINIDYEYAVYYCENDAMVHANYIRNIETEIERQDHTEFPKFADFDYYFAIRFPTKTSSILYDMNVWFISAFVLITAIFFFVYAIYIILGQKKLSEVQKNFIDNMTHELKTPISTIAISAKVISDPIISTQPERLHQYATIISNQTKRLESQVEKVLQSTLSKKGNINLEIESININDSLAKTINDCEFKAHEKNGEIILNIDAKIEMIMADKNHFENLFFNLLDNAIKYCNTSPKIIVSTRLKGKKIYVSVDDNGIGIEEKYRKKIFKKFFRVPTGNIHDVKGFGLGLDYVKNIVKAHKWKILLDCEPAKGCKFTIVIPQ